MTLEAASLGVHIAAGSLAVLTGYVAIFAAKGARLHRRSGMVFVYAMIVMGMAASVVAIFRDLQNLMLSGPLVAYFVITAVTAVRPVDRRLDVGLFLIALTLALLGYLRAGSELAQGRYVVNGVPVAMSLLMTSVTMVAAVSDIRVLRGTVLTGPSRIARHLWRMCWAFWIATGSFFLGQMDEFPVWLQKPALMAIPALLPLVLMFYWLWRIRLRKAFERLTLREA